MNLRHAAVLVALACGLTGCGPKPTTPTGEPGNPSASLDGTWTITRVEVAPGETPPPAEDLGKIVVLVQGNHLTGRMRDQNFAHYAVVEVDATASPKTITLTESDETWDTNPIKVKVFHTAPFKEGERPVPTERVEPRPKIKGLFTQDGDTAKLVIATHPDAPAPTEFAPKAAGKKWDDPGATAATTAQTVVLHLTRVKETPEWATKPPPRDMPTGTTKPASPRPPTPTSK
jgi:uncharacterized protein (TIGR03067 family)